ncbi:MAG: leucine-rich repeat protein, partial [Oscillospiraceae bacterium]|nr:leucine-rich repeat protein [Oscillospiraceae bacterium]
MKKLKALLASITALSCLCVSYSIFANAEYVSGCLGDVDFDFEEYKDNLTWNFDESTGTLTISGTGAMENRSSYLFRPYYWSDIKEIIIEDGVTTIGDGAFYGCESLIAITIPDSVTTIGASAFYRCESLIAITIPDSVTTIGESAFYGCESLIAITIPDSVTTIGRRAFWGCNSLESVTIPESVTTIGEYAFYKLVCPINVDENNPNYYSQEGILFSKEKSELIYFPYFDNVVEYTIPDGVTSIGEYAFGERYTLESIIIPDSVVTIGSRAFSHCTSLTSVTVSDSVTTIGSNAFWDCISLTSITIPDSVTTIGDFAFGACTSLTSITIPDSVTTIGYRAFSYCSALKSITIENPECEIYDDTICKTTTIYGYDDSTAQAYAEKYDINFISLGTAPEKSNTDIEILTGDANQDGEFNLLDIIALQKWLLGTCDLPNWQAIDFNQDGMIN